MRQFCWGDKAFRKELLEQMRERIGPERYGQERQETAQQKAEAILEAELRQRRLSQQRLQGLPKGDKAKVAMARRLQAPTTMTVGWIAERLEMGSRRYARLNHLGSHLNIEHLLTATPISRTLILRARSFRIDRAGSWYHVTSRGNGHCSFFALKPFVESERRLVRKIEGKNVQCSDVTPRTHSHSYSAKFQCICIELCPDVLSA